MFTDLESRVLRLIEQNQTDLITSLQQMIRYKTVTPDMDACAEGEVYREHQKYIRTLLAGMDFETEMWEIDAAQLEEAPGRGVRPDRDLRGMPVVVGRLPGAINPPDRRSSTKVSRPAAARNDEIGRSLLLNGHYDVVPEGDAALWTYDPYSATLANGRLYGRGTADMKGGNAAMLFAVKMIREAGLRINGDLTVQIVPDEEATCMGTLACCLRGYTADAAFIPEPTNMGLLVAMRGSVYGQITVPGRAGHAEMAQPPWTEGGAVNAISKAAKVVQMLDALAEEWRPRPDRQHKLIGPDFVLVTSIHGGEWEVTYPEKAEIRFGAMIAPPRGNPVDEIRAKLAELALSDPWMAAHPPTLTHGPWYYGAEVAEGEPIVRAAASALTDLGIPPELSGFGSLTDAIHLINLSKIPTISVGPDMDTIHAADESIEIRQLVELSKTIALLVIRWCGVSGQS